MKNIKIIAIIGTTGVGKSKLAIEMAKRFNGEVVNADAMQMYKGLDIATNKVSEEEMERIPHHLLGTHESSEELTVHDFVREALDSIHDISSRHKLPIIVGGTHYYIQSLLLESLSNIPAVKETSSSATCSIKMSENDRIEVECAIDKQDSLTLHRLLEKYDPVMARRWHPKDIRKITKSLLFCIEQGIQHSHYLLQMNAQSRFNVLIYCLHCNFDILDTHLDHRVDKMISSGLMDELSIEFDKLFENKKEDEQIDFTRGILQTIGFKEFYKYFSQKSTDVSPCIQQMKDSTRRYARKQVRWIKNRLVPNLSSDCQSHFYVLDTDFSNWNSSILKKAQDITKSFLAESFDLPDPSLVSSVYESYVSKDKTPQNKLAQWEKHYCELCEFTSNGKVEYHAHLNSKRHQNMQSIRNSSQWPFFEAAKKVRLAQQEKKIEM